MTIGSQFFGTTPYMGSPIDEPYYNEVECELCGGEGFYYESYADERLTPEEWKALDESERDDFMKRYCPHCDGLGRIAI